MKNILITGGCGYIGSKLVPFLLDKDYKITVIDRMDFGNNLTDHPNLTIIHSDLLNTTVEDYEGYDSVVHLAALSNDPMANFKPSDNFVQNLAVTALVGFLAKKAGVKKFVFAGSCSVYGRSPDNCSDETIKPHSDFPYGISKLQSEKTLKSLVDDNFKVISMRQATVFGWAPRMRTDLVVNTMTKFAILDKTITVNNASALRPLIHIDDLCNVYWKVLELPKIPFVMNVSTGNYSVVDIANEVKNAISKHKKGIKINVKDIYEPRSYFVDNSLMKNVIGELMPVTIEQAVDELYNHLGDDAEEWSNPDYINLEMYKRKFLNEQT